MFHLTGQVDFGNKARIQKLQRDLKMLEQILDSVDEDKARQDIVNVPNKRQFVEPERSAIRADDSDTVLERYPDDVQWQLCPDTVDRLECFESYMVLWLHMVGERQGKRTYIGKRSDDDDSIDNTANRKPNLRLTDILLGRDLADDRQKQLVDNKVTESLLLDGDQIRYMCSNSRNKDLCYRLGLTKAMGTFFNSLAKGSSSSAVANSLRKRGLCDGAADTVSCFDYYLGMYANMHSSSSGANQFVGRRMVHKK